MTKALGACLLAFVVSAASPKTYAASVREEWVARYNGVGNGRDGAKALAVDADGNAYVTGFTWVGVDVGYDYGTIKYSPKGDELWVERYDGPGHEDDFAWAIAVDAASNVYVTGESFGSTSPTDGHDYATIKYDTDGNQLWVARYDGPTHGYDTAKSIALDGAGNVYVTGYSERAGSGYDYATVKYDADGNEVWVARYNSGSPNAYDYAAKIAVDFDGNVYVTGHSSRGGYSDYATIKYDTDGNQLWVARYSGPANHQNGANALAVDAEGNAYVTGYSFGIGTDYDYATIKYDPDGNELWVARYDGPTHGSDFAYAMAVDGAGAVYVTGASSRTGSSGFNDYTTVKYTSAGKEVWVARHSGGPAWASNQSQAIALDATGNVYVTGFGSGFVRFSYDQDYITVKYDNQGNELWVMRYNFDYGLEDVANAIALDGAGNVFVTGQSHAVATDFDYATIKYSQ